MIAQIKRFYYRLRYRRQIKHPHPRDENKHQLFKLGTEMEFEGRKFRYYKAGGDIKVGPVMEEE